MDRYLLSGAFGLLIFQILFLLHSLGIIGPYFDSDSILSSDRQVIGQLVQKRQSVKRKSADSIIWEDSEAKDTLYRYDSILTLDHSTANLTLENDVRLHVQENTLVVLEPLEKDKDSLRVRFQRGQMRSRNAGQKFSVGTGEWSVEAAPGSELSLRATEDNKVELEINDGEVELVNKRSGEQKQFSEGQKLTLSQEAVTSIQTVTNDLRLNFQTEKRVYSHEFPVAIPISWSGHAQWLKIAQLGGFEHRLQLSSADDGGTTLLSLPPGTYSLSLESLSGEISKTELLELIPSPKIRYLSPLPRDRAAVGKKSLFSWYPIEEVQTYEVRFSKTSQESNLKEDLPAITSTAPFTEFTPPGAGAYTWSVFAKDLDGIAIPPYYSIPVYFAADPLAAPKLMAPQPRAPANEKPKAKPDAQPPPKGDSVWIEKIWHALLPSAHAEEAAPATVPTPGEPPTPERQIIFNWYPVDGADFYIVEVSSKADFLKPEVIQKVTKEEFEWSGFDEKIYYWRVAAGSKDGRMGVFSDPAEFDVKALKRMRLSDFGPGLRYVEVTPKPKAEPAQPKTPPVVKPPSEKPKDAPPQAPPPENFVDVNLNVDYWVMSQKTEDVDRINFKGLALPSLAITKSWSLGQSTYVTKLGWQQLKWKPESEVKLPFQNEFTTNVLKLKVFKLVPQGLSWGILIEQLPFIEREDLEKVTYDETLLAGLMVNWRSHLSPEISWNSQFSLAYGDDFYQPTWENELRYYVAEDSQKGTFFGGLFDVSAAIGKDDRSATWLRLGFEVGYTW